MNLWLLIFKVERQECTLGSKNLKSSICSKVVKYNHKDSTQQQILVFSFGLFHNKRKGTYKFTQLLRNCLSLLNIFSTGEYPQQISISLGGVGGISSPMFTKKYLCTFSKKKLY